MTQLWQELVIVALTLNGTIILATTLWPQPDLGEKGGIGMINVEISSC